MGRTLRNIAIGTGLIVAVGLSGCTTLYEKDPVVREVVGTMPRFLQPGAYRDAQERKMREEVRERNQGERSKSIQVSSPHGYVVNLQEETYVFYQGKEHYIHNLIPPYVEFIVDSGGVGWDKWKRKKVRIKDLDMFKE